MPVDFGDVSFNLNKPGFENIRIYRDFQFGTLIPLVMTDERLYRDDHVATESVFEYGGAVTRRYPVPHCNGLF